MNNLIVAQPSVVNDKLISDIKEKWYIADTYYKTAVKKLILLDATDKGDLWKALQAKFPAYQIMPDTNWVSYVKNNILASIYTVTKCADVIPTCEMDREICLQLSTILEHIWSVEHVGYYQFLAGERAALLNQGLTHVGWDKFKSRIKLKNVDPMKFRRDPYAASLEEAGWCVMFDNYHKSVFEGNPLYKEKFAQFKSEDGRADDSVPDYPDRPKTDSSPGKDHFNLFIWYVRDGNKINEYHLLDNKFVLYTNEAIKPNRFPIVELSCNLPGTSLVGSSEPAKIFANNLAYNLMKSIAFTAEYKNQRPPKFISNQSGLNLRAFSKHGDEADRTFIVNGDATRAVHYQQFPFISPGLGMMLEDTQKDIQATSGVDGRYTGRNSGSIQTTGGTEQMLDRVTLIDTPKVMNYEKYCRNLTELILEYMIQFTPKRTYFVRDMEQLTAEAKWIPVEVDFPSIKKLTDSNQIVREYTIQISSELPRTRQHNQQWANMIMEKQMQYREQGLTVDLLTEEEWLMYQDVPYKEQMLERMGVQRQNTSLEQTAQVVHEYTNLLKQGYPPNEAMILAAQGLDAKRQGAATPFEEQQAQSQAQQAPLAGQGPASPMGGGMPIPMG